MRSKDGELQRREKLNNFEDEFRLGECYADFVLKVGLQFSFLVYKM